MLLFRSAQDPLGDEDSFSTLSPKEQAELWTYGEEKSLADRLREVQRNFEAIIPVDVKLVGFDGDGNTALLTKDHELLKYLDAALNEVESHVINVGDDDHHNLPIHNKFVFNVIKSSRTLAAAVERAIHDAARKSKAIPHTVVDDIIHRDFKESPLATYTIYVLNPNYPFPLESADEAGVQYWYVPGAGVGAKPQMVQCPTSLWIGQDRYVWIDLTAGPLSYGPATSGEGLVWSLALPRMIRFTTVETITYPRIDTLMAELSALVLRTCMHIIVPSLDSYPPPYTRRTKVKVTVIQDQPDWRRHTNPPTDDKFDMEIIKTQLSSLVLSGQTLEFEKTVTDFGKCEYCAVAFNNALKSHTSTILSGVLRTHVHQYLDATELRWWLQRLDPNRDDFMYYGNRYLDFDYWDDYYADYHGSFDEDEEDEWMHYDGVGDDGSEFRTIRVYLFDLKRTELLLLDRFHQAMAFPDMVIAVQTQSGRTSMDFTCMEQRVTVDATDVTRAVLGSILQTGWAVAPTQKVWSPLRNESIDDWLFSTSSTPFGPLSTATQLTFSQRDAALRNIIFSQIHATVDAIRHLLSHFRQYGKEVEEVVSPDQFTRFVRRWNVLRHKVLRAGTFLSLHNYNTSLYYLRSSRHDTRALHSILKDATKQLHPYLSCYKTESWISFGKIISLLALSIIGCSCSYGILVHVRRHPANKRL